jgi:transcriptional regulator with XRE-family HTH domain
MTESSRNAKSTGCNGTLIRQLREVRGWTQAELAERTGYSERLIVKAESGRPLARGTIDNLAVALSADASPIYFEDLTTDPVVLARKYTEALYRHRENLVDAIRHFLDDEVSFRISGDPTVVPFAGEHTGIDAIDRGFKLFFSIMDVPERHDHEKYYRYIADGNDVVVWGESWIHPKGQPLARPMSIANLMRFRRGKLYRFEDNYDTHWAATVLSGASD